MKLVLSAKEHGEAIEQYMDNEHNIQMDLGVTLGPVELDFEPSSVSVAMPKASTAKVKTPVVDTYQEDTADEAEAELANEDSERDMAVSRAEELGISFRSDIKTETLVKRIEEHEEELAAQIEADERPDEVDLDIEDDLSQEIPVEEEAKPKAKKPSMFTARKAAKPEPEADADDHADEVVVEEPKPKRSSFFDRNIKTKSDE